MLSSWGISILRALSLSLQTRNGVQRGAANISVRGTSSFAFLQRNTLAVSNLLDIQSKHQLFDCGPVRFIFSFQNLCSAKEREEFLIILRSVLFLSIAESFGLQKFVEQPKYTEVNPGEDALLTCKIIDKRGSCSWQKDNKVCKCYVILFSLISFPLLSLAASRICVLLRSESLLIFIFLFWLFALPNNALRRRRSAHQRQRLKRYTPQLTLALCSRFTADATLS